MSVAAFLNDDYGTTLTEYGVLMASFSLLAIAGMLLVSDTANTILGNIFTQTTDMQLCPPGTTGC